MATFPHAEAGAFSTQALRAAWGRYPTGVAVVTAQPPGARPVALTINSFASVSLSPPLVAWSLATRSSRFDAFSTCTHFGLSILAADQTALAQRFARPPADEDFDDPAFVSTPEGVPLIGAALAAMVCARAACWPAGDHALLLGRVVRLHDRGGTPLVFHEGRFTTLR